MTLRIADHPVTEAERADLRVLLGAEDEPVRGACGCICGCQAAAIGDADCQRCAAGDHLWPEARS